jgi:hypothetical protein
MDAKFIRQIGNRLRERIPAADWDNPSKRSELLDLFMQANAWRDSHIRPMASVRSSVRALMRVNALPGDMAARPKRMSSIRRKLRESGVTLDKMNDLGGCRAIIENISSTKTLIDVLQYSFKHDIIREYSYIDQPKPDGYRSHHFVFSYCPRSRDDEHLSGRRIELQVRTRLQHAWATAVEAVGLYIGEDLKHHKGSEKWLRLFCLASAEFALAEQCAAYPDVPDHEARISELSDLNRELNAVEMLENIKNATHFAETFLHDPGKYYLIRYNPNHTVDVSTFRDLIEVTELLAKQEQRIESGNDDAKVVIVEVDKVEKLIETYPNYFGDVSLFVSNLRSICTGSLAVEYTLPRQPLARPRIVDRIDPSALKRRYTIWSDEPKPPKGRPRRT